MKPQLRGRIRRNVTTLLELGADVTVLTVCSSKDFYVGLEHDRLTAEYFEARSLYVRLSQAAARRSLEQASRRQARAQAGDDRTTSDRPVLLTPLSLVGLVLLTVLKVLLVAARSAGRVVAAAAAPAAPALVALWRRLPLRARQAAWATARRSVLMRRRARRRWERQLRPRLLEAADGLVHPLRPILRRLGVTPRWVPGARRRPAARRRAVPDRFWSRRLILRRAVLRRRRDFGRALLNRRLELSRGTVRWAKDRLRPWHRISRFFAFWRESADRGVELAPDLVVSSDLPGLVGAGRIARRLAIPHVHDCHELYLESTSFRTLERRLLAPIERWYFRRADSIVAVNKSIAVEYARRYGREPVVVRNCAPRIEANPEVRDLRALAGLPASARVVLYQGGFSVGRGLDICVAAVVDLPVDVHLVMLGFGPLREELLEQAEALGVSHRVHFLDAVPPEELASCTISATVGLMPYQPVSQNNFLALPNKIFEYTAAGVPIVVSDLPELRRIAIDAGCGDVYDPFDATSLAAALGRVLDPAHYERHRAAAREFGRVNVWENERDILIGELLRASPQLRESARSERPRLELVD